MSVLLHELTHSQNMDEVNLAAMSLLENRNNESASVKQFLDRVGSRLSEAGERIYQRRKETVERSFAERGSYVYTKVLEFAPSQNA